MSILKPHEISILLDYINEAIEREKENLDECHKLGCGNTPGAGMCIGAMEAYEDVKNQLLQFMQPLDTSQ